MRIKSGRVVLGEAIMRQKTGTLRCTNTLYENGSLFTAGFTWRNHNLL